MKNFLPVFLKEIRSVLRDRRAFASMLLPLLLFPMIYKTMDVQFDKTEESLSREIAVYCDAPEEIKNYIKSDLLSDIPIKYTDSEDASKDLLEDRLNLIIEPDSMEIGKFPIYVKLIYNSNSNISSNALNKISASLSLKNAEIAVMSLKQSGIDPAVMNNINIETEDKSVNMLLASMAPTLISMLLASGCVSISVDVFAGEKERGTLERVLATQVNRFDLILGKYAAILICGLFCAIVSLLSYILAMKISPNIMELYGGTDFSFNLGLKETVSLIFSIFAYAMLIAALFMFVSLMSKSAKAAQSFIAVINLIPGMIGIMAMMTPLSGQSPVTMLIPIYSSVSCFRILLSGTFIPSLIISGTLSTVLYSIVLFIMTYWLLSSEKVKLN